MSNPNANVWVKVAANARQAARDSKPKSPPYTAWNFMTYWEKIYDEEIESMRREKP